MSILTQELQGHWQVLGPLLTIHSEDDYEQAVERMNQLIDEVGTAETHPLYALLDTLGTLVHAYEEEHYRMPAVSGIEALRYLMAEHELTQSELSEIGSQGIVSEILNGKRTLNVRQIQALSQRFGVSPSVFF
jgi:HTH-type transcriptional regulator/antitoxin HigA